MTVTDLILEFKKYSVDGMHAANVLKYIKADKKTTNEKLKNDIRNYDRSTIKRALQLLVDEGCIEIKGKDIIFKKDC